MNRFWLILIATVITSVRFTPPVDTGSIRIKVNQLRNDRGRIRVCLYNSSQGFPSNAAQCFKTAVVDAQKGRVEVVFSELPLGEYAISLMHDENGNGKMDTNFIGIPKEGYGASNDAKATFGPPKYDDAKVTLDKPLLELAIKVRYF